jgi:hypothetical protein
MPFLRTLTGVPIIWLAAGEDVETNRQYLVANGLKVDNIVTLDDAGITRIPSTPTVVLIDKGGLVVKAWVGVMGSAEQSDLRSRLAGRPDS